MLSVSFACIKSRQNKSGQSPIQLWVNIDGKRATTILDLRATPKEFDKAMKSKRSNHILLYCNNVRQKITEYYSNILCSDDNPTPSDIIEYVKDGFRIRQNMLYKLFEDFLRIERCKVGHEIKEKTYMRYCLVVDKFKKVVPDKQINQVTYSDILEYKFYLINVCKLGSSTLCSYLKKAKSIFAYAIDNGLISSSPFQKLKIKSEEVEITPLSTDELLRIANKDFRLKRLEQVRDCFIFACNTALAYSDLASIKFEDIKEQYGVYYIQKYRVKTGVQFTIPLNDTALSILEKYEYHLPILSNQKYNSYLKEIADICGIEKNLTTHLARHTAATLMLNSGISIDVVAKILGHSNTRMTHHYAKMLDNTIINTKIVF